MEEFGDWIYIIIIIIAAVSSLIGSIRKKTQQAAQQNLPREIVTNDGSPEDFWDDYIPRAETKPVSAIPQKPPVRPSGSSIDKKYFDLFQEREVAFGMETSKTFEVVESQGLITTDDLPADIDEWRKAFVYNEIFSRKN